GFTAFSPQYGAPEQFFAKRYGSTGPWTDVYALGLCLVELVTGKMALDGEEAQEFFESSTSEIRPTPRARGASVSDDFEAICAKALAKMPKDRYPNAGALQEALSALIPARTSGAPRVSHTPEAASASVVDASETGAWLAAREEKQLGRKSQSPATA